MQKKKCTEEIASRVDRHLSRKTMRLPDPYHDALDALVKVTRRDKVEEVKIALERYFESQGIVLNLN